MRSCFEESKTLFANHNDLCYKFYVQNGKVCCEEVQALYCSHEEADNRMFFHLTYVQAPSNVVIRTADTDCFVISLGCMKFYHETLNVWLEVGIQSKNTLRYIDINQLHTTLGQSLCDSLPAYHAFTGCDYTSSFSQKGKVKPLKLLEGDISAQNAFSQLGIVTNALPPCHSVLLQKMKRTNFVAKAWMSSVSSHPLEMDATDHGWKMTDDGSYKICWFDGDASPKSLDACTV